MTIAPVAAVVSPVVASMPNEENEHTCMQQLWDSTGPPCDPSSLETDTEVVSYQLFSPTCLLTCCHLLFFSPIVTYFHCHLLSLRFSLTCCQLPSSHLFVTLFVLTSCLFFWVVDITSNSLTPHVPRTTLSLHARTIGEMFLLNVADTHWALASNFGKVSFPLVGVETRGKS